MKINKEIQDPEELKREIDNLRGILSKYANPALRQQEKYAWAKCSGGEICYK